MNVKQLVHDRYVASDLSELYLCLSWWLTSPKYFLDSIQPFFK